MEIKNKRLSACKGEVEDFHPLLHSVFRKAADITHVEYTHGQHEKGADFVLTRHNTTLDCDDYIGIIAKVGSLSKSDVRNLEEQIKDCRMARYTLNGKRIITLNEIWIVNNSSISHQAEDVINDTFKGQKIEFIDRDRLIGRIDKWFPGFWSEIPPEASSYFHRVNSFVATEEQKLALIPAAAAIYVPPTLYHERKRRPGLDWHKATRTQEKWEDDIKDNSFLLIESDAGGGKSKLLRFMASTMASPRFYQENKLIPVLSTVKSFIEEFDGDPMKLVESVMGHDFPLVADDKATPVLLLDALDESASSEEEMCSRIEQLLSVAEGSYCCKIVVATRQHTFDKSKALNDGKVRRLQISPLSTEQIFRFIDALCKQLSPNSRLREDIKESPLFREIPRSPIVAILLAEILNQETDELPSTLPELYSKYFELMLGRWEISKGLRLQKEYDALDAILMEVAENFMLNSLPSMALDEVRNDYFDSYLKSRRSLELDPDDLLHKAMSRCNIIYVDVERNLFSFRHRTFAEFLYAKKAIKTKSTALVHDNVYTLYWAHTAYFYVGLLKDCAEILQQLLEIQPKTEFGEIMKMDSFGSFLLAAYVTPDVARENAIRCIAEEMGRYCADVLSKRRPTEFINFPPMMFLMFIQYAFAARYGYKFLGSALKLVIEEIATAPKQSDHGAYALFLLSSALDKAGTPEHYSNLLESYGDIPIYLQFAIQASTSDKTLTRKDHLLKKHNARITKEVKKAKGLQAFYVDCFKKPIKLLKS